MGIQSYLNSLMERVQRNLLKLLKQEEPIKEKAKPLAPPPPQNLGEDIRLMVQSKRFESAYSTAAPFLFASLGAWPGYWVYRGMDYHVHRSHIPLKIYIRQTYYQAKMVQLFIILAGTYTVFRNNSIGLTTTNVGNSKGGATSSMS